MTPSNDPRHAFGADRLRPAPRPVPIHKGARFAERNLPLRDPDWAIREIVDDAMFEALR